MVFSRHQIGADYFIRGTGRRVSINEKAFFEWPTCLMNKKLKQAPKQHFFSRNMEGNEFYHFENQHIKFLFFCFFELSNGRLS